MTSSTGISWEAIGMTLTIISSIGIPFLVFIWVTGKKFGEQDQITEQHNNEIIAAKASIESIKTAQNERDLRLYNKLDELKDGLSTCNQGISEIRGYEMGKQTKQ